jgi:hypothetical protein
MSGRITLGFVQIVEFSSTIERVRCALVRSFLVRNWCGSSGNQSQDLRHWPLRGVRAVLLRSFARGADRFSRARGRADRHEAHVADTDEAQRLAQIRRRQVDAATVHAGDEIAAAGQDHNRRPVFQQRHVSLRGIEPERQSGLRDHIDPLFQLVGNAEIPHRG